MGKPTYASVTEIPCSCGYLENSARDQNVPIVFDPRSNEYHIEAERPTGTKVSVVIYHCPFCGGAAPESQRDKLFVEIPDDERRRLEDMVREIKSLKDVERMLGKPDIDKPIYFPPGLSGLEINKEPRRTLTFTRISKIADIHLTIYVNDDIEVFIIGKQIRDAASTHVE